MSRIFGKIFKGASHEEDLATSSTASNTSSGDHGLTTPRRDHSRSPSPASTQRNNIGLIELSKHDEQATVDVVAVHGLQGDPYKTWTHENGKLWLRDFLPADIPYARIMTFGYESTIAFSKSVAEIDDKAVELLNRLTLKRSADEISSSMARPIVFIGHSLGGIIIKKALIIANERSSDADYRDILENTKAIAFLGVPHKGSDSAWWASFAVYALKGATMSTSTNSALVSNLRKDSAVLVDISNSFVPRTTGLVIYTFYETRRLSNPGPVIVDKLSACIGLPNEKLLAVDANHRTICKIPSAESQEYEAVGKWIVKLVKEAVREIGHRPSASGHLTVSGEKGQSYHNSSEPHLRRLSSDYSSVNTRNQEGKTPLIDAAERNSIELGKVLLAEGADYKITDYNGDTPLKYCAWRNYVEFGRLLLEAAQKNGDIQVILEQHTGQNPRNALRDAACNGCTEFVRLLVDAGSDCASQGKSEGFGPGRVPVRRMITNLDPKKTALIWAAENAHAEVVELLLTAAATQCSDRATMVEFIDSRDSQGMHALAHAEAHGFKETARIINEFRQRWA